jgi:hypothetical protein
VNHDAALAALERLRSMATGDPKVIEQLVDAVRAALPVQQPPIEAVCVRAPAGISDKDRAALEMFARFLAAKDRVQLDDAIRLALTRRQLDHHGYFGTPGPCWLDLDPAQAQTEVQTARESLIAYHYQAAAPS